MKIEFDHINLNFENIDVSDERQKKISHLIWKLLDEKFERYANSSNNDRRGSNVDKINKSNGLTLDRIVVPPIHVDSHRSDYDIASHCASAIYQAIIVRLQ